MSFPHQNQFISIHQLCPQAPSFQGTPKELVDLNPLDFYLWSHLKPPAVYLAPVENEETLLQCIFMPVKPFATTQDL
jgi:hypothetical protein